LAAHRAGQGLSRHAEARPLLRLFPQCRRPIVKTTEEYHAVRQSQGDDVVVFIERLKVFGAEQKTEIIERRQRLTQVA
jgi:hypothetical protein